MKTIEGDRDETIEALCGIRPGETVEYHHCAEGRSMALDGFYAAGLNDDQRVRASAIAARGRAALRLHEEGRAFLVQRRNDDRTLSYLAIGRQKG